jgi:hypothetical protein
MMRVARCADAAAFLAAGESWLVQREAEHCLLLGIATTLVRTPALYKDVYLALVHDDAGAIRLGALMTPPHNLVLGTVDDPAAVAALVEDVLALYPATPGVTAPKDAAHRFAEAWTRRTGAPHRVTMHERLYRLVSVNPASGRGVPGIMREAAAADRELLIAWSIAFELEAIGRVNRDAVAAFIDQVLASRVRRYFLWEDERRVVSLAGCGGRTPNGMRVGPVYTPPERRGRGYATACVAALSRRLLEEGRRFMVLFTDLANPTSNHIYQQIGYEPVTDFDMIGFDKVG